MVIYQKIIEKDIFMDLIKKSDNFINRELSWLRFNTRVLEEAQNKRHPLLERLKFLAIYGTNLDEFYMIRVAGLKEMFKARYNINSPDGLTTKEQLHKIRTYIHEELQSLETIYNSLTKELQTEGIFFKSYKKLSVQEAKEADEFFYSHLYPVIIPIAINATHPFPHFNNLSFAIAVKLKEEGSGKTRFGLVRIPRVLPRYFEANGTFVPVESIVQVHLEDIFPGFTPESYTDFRVTRNADIVIEEEEADDFMDVLEESIRSRRKGEIVRLEMRETHDSELLNFMISHLNVDVDDVYFQSVPINFGSLWQIVGNKNYSHLLYEPYTPKTLAPLHGRKSVIKSIENSDALMFLPYESFDPVARFIKEATEDPDVLAIKITLYRVGKNSPIVTSLIEAAREGKQVTAIVELKARFDEENNLKWAKKLEDAGAHVIYGIAGLKIHAKAALVVKQTSTGIKQYAHLSTGNYNPATSRIYTDLSFFTSDQRIAADLTKFFHHITGFSKKTELDVLWMSPSQIKPKILSLIENEAQKGEEGEIIAKMNSLVDEDIIEALYKASNSGVRISLIVRGICCLRPGLEGVSKNIRVVSIVGKYLEHSRIFYFKNASPQIYFSSADWMPRNLLKRIELLTPVYDSEIAGSILEMLRVQLNDNVQSRELHSDGTYIKVKNGLPRTDSQSLMEKAITVANNNNIRGKKRSGKIQSRVLKANQ